MRRLYSKLLTLILCLSIWTTASAFTVDGLNYTVSNGVATLTGATSKSITSLTVPATVTYSGKTYPVNFILHSAFNNYSSLKSVHFNDSEDAICSPEYKDSNGWRAFSSPFINCPIEEIYFGRDRAVMLGTGIREDYLQLATTSPTIKITYAGKTKHILNQNFNDILKTNLTELVIGDSITDINRNAFTDCVNLHSLTLLQGSYNIPSSALPSTIDTLNLIGTQFTQTPYATPKHVTFGDAWVTIPSSFFIYCKTLTSVNFPESLINIDKWAFNGCDQLQNLQFSNNLETIGSNAFDDCNSLTELSIPGSVTSIGVGAFYCDNLNKVIFESSSKAIEFGTYIFTPNPLDSLILNREIPALDNCYPVHVVFGEGWQNIPDSFFQTRNSIISVSLPSSLKTIGNKAFFQCNSLSEIKLPSNLTSIGSWAFNGCIQISNIQFGNKLESIGSNAFDDCNSLTELSIPGSVTSIGVGAFYCDNLHKITFETSSKAIEFGGPIFTSNQVDSLILNREIPLLDNCFPVNVVFGEGWQTIPDSFFKSKRSITTVSLPSTLISIESSAFLGCTSLSKVTLPINLKTIGSSAFSACDNLTSIITLAKTPPICDGNYVFASSIYPTAELTVPMGSKRKYKSAEVWKNFANIHTDGAMIVSVEYDHNHGEVTLNGEAAESIELDEGEALNVGISPAIGYAIGSVTVNGENCTALLQNGVLHYNEIDDSLTIVVEFTPIMFDINLPTSITGGHIEINDDANAPAQLQYGTSVTLKPVANEGYEFKTLKINGGEVTLNDEGVYVIDSLTENITIDATFEIITFKVTANYDSAMGIVTLNGQTGETRVNYGSALTIQASPAEGHYISSLSVYGEQISKDKFNEPYIIESVKDSVVVEVTFSIYTYTITTIYDNDLGSVSINGSEGTAHVDWNTDAVVNITPAYGYQIASVEMDGEDVTDEVDSNGQLTISAVKADHQLKVEFEIKRVSLSIAVEGGSVKTIYDFGTEIHYIPVGDNGWQFHSATVGSEVITELDDDNGFVVGPLTENINLSVVFTFTTSVDSPNISNNVKVTIRENAIVIEGAPEEAIAEVFDTNGVNYYSGLKRKITLNKSGVYIVTILGQSYKVMLR